MKRIGSASVIWVGPAGGESFQRLTADLRRHGLGFIICKNPDQLPQTLSRTPRAVVVVLDDPSASLADATLTALQSVCRPIPVVVLIEKSAFGHYYDLMGRGVRHYYAASESPEQIARAVQYTVAHAA